MRLPSGWRIEILGRAARSPYRKKLKAVINKKTFAGKMLAKVQTYSPWPTSLVHVPTYPVTWPVCQLYLKLAHLTWPTNEVDGARTRNLRIDSPML